MHRRDGLSWGPIATITGLPSSNIRGKFPRRGGHGFPRPPDNPSTRRKLCNNAGTLDSEGTRARRPNPYDRSGGLWNNSRQRPRRRQPHPGQAAEPEAVTLRSQQPREEERA